MSRLDLLRSLQKPRKVSGKSISRNQILQLQREAGMAGDALQYAICEKALTGNRSARAECARVINEARAMWNASDESEYG